MHGHTSKQYYIATCIVNILKLGYCSEIGTFDVSRPHTEVMYVVVLASIAYYLIMWENGKI